MTKILLTLLLIIPSTTVAFANKAPSEAAQRRPWEFGRFVRQSSKFVSPFPQRVTGSKIQPGEVLWEPSSNSALSFGPLDDVVMGGASSSTFDNNNGVWRGTVTDANNGGFIGFRSYPTQKWDMRDCRGIEVKLRGGSGKRFKFGMRDSPDFNGICWTTSFVAGGNPVLKLFESSNKAGDGSMTIKIPFNKQVPTRFARIVPNQTFDKTSVSGIQLAYSKFEYDGDLNPNFSLGDVELQILSIKAY
jgi:hypothetical protein